MTQAQASHGDEVDLIVEAWQRERPDLDVSPLQVLSRISRLSRHLDAARKQAFADHGLEPWEFDVLAALRRAGEPYSMAAGHLATATLVTSGTMTNRIDRLEERGLVARAPDPDDRRAVLVALTDQGRSCVDGAITDLVDAEAKVLRSLPAARQRELAALLRPLLASFDAEG